MRRALVHSYYVAAYYASWVVFLAVGLALNLVCAPLLLLPHRDTYGPRTRRVIRNLFDFWVRWFHASRVLQITWTGFDAPLTPGTVYIANHPTLLDATFLLARLPDAICIFKPALMHNPAIGPAALMAGYALLVFVLPFDLIWAYLRLRPSGAMDDLAGHVLAFGAAVWIYLTLTESVVLAVQEADSGGRRRCPRRPCAGLAVGGVLSLFGVIALINATKSADWIGAAAEVQRQLGPRYRTFVRGVNWTDADGPSPTEASAIAYNDHSYRRVIVSCEGSPHRPLTVRDVTASDDPYGPGRGWSTWQVWLGP